MSGIKNAIIKKFEVKIERGFMLDCSIEMGYGGGSFQAFGGYCLYTDKNGIDHGNFAGHFIYRALEIIGVENASDAVGMCVRVEIEDGKIRAIGHIVNDDWFCPREDFDEFNKNKKVKDEN